MGLEIELKVGLESPEDRARLLRLFGPPERTILQTNLFLADPEDRLDRAGGALRVRRERVFPAAGPPVDRVRLAFKTGGGAEGALFSREEHECPLGLELEAVERDPSALLSLGLEPIRALEALVPGLDSLRALGSFTNDRAVLRVPFESGGRTVDAAWEVDRARFPDGSVDCEVELELADPADARSALAALERELGDAGIRMRPQPKSKYARFRERLR